MSHCLTHGEFICIGLCTVKINPTVLPHRKVLGFNSLGGSFRGTLKPKCIFTSSHTNKNDIFFSECFSTNWEDGFSPFIKISMSFFVATFLFLNRNLILLPCDHINLFWGLWLPWESLGRTIKTKWNDIFWSVGGQKVESVPFQWCYCALTLSFSTGACWNDGNSIKMDDGHRGGSCMVGHWWPGGC